MWLDFEVLVKNFVDYCIVGQLVGWCDLLQKVMGVFGYIQDFWLDGMLYGYVVCLFYFGCDSGDFVG